MGSILDSSIVIAAERARWGASQLMHHIADKLGDDEVALSAVGYTELLLGFYREQDPQRRLRREGFFRDLLLHVPVYDYTSQIAVIAGKIGGQQAAAGETVPFSDLLIGATALSLGFSILTLNLRHFRMIPDLEVIPF